MKRILCIGDSHTWGEGAVGIDGYFDPPAVGGDSRPVPYTPPCYVNLLRNALCDGFRALLPEDLPYPREGMYAVSNRMSLSFTGSYIRVMLLYHPQGGTVRFALDGSLAAETDTCFDPSLLPPARTAPRTHRFTGLTCEPGVHTLTLTSDRPIYLFCAEPFGGDCMVLNSGIGSCPTGLYLSEYWDTYVACYQPDEVIINPMSINDWIVQTTLEDYRTNLRELVSRTRTLGAKPVLTTVAPIAGDKYFGDSGIHFDQYIEATRQVAREENVPLADSNRAIREAARDCPDEAAFFAAFLHDNWHPNNEGHRIYAETILAARE